jgi:protein dithiol:quinone oxidoreductase
MSSGSLDPSTRLTFRSSAAQRPLVLMVIAAVAIGLIGIAVAFQYREPIDPCPFCILQRYAYLAVAVCAAAAAGLLAAGLAGARIAIALGALGALAGAAVAGWQVKVQLFPNEADSCSIRFQQTINDLPLGRLLPSVFTGTGSCSDTDFTLLGLTIPMWSLLWLTALALALAFQLRRPARVAGRR